LPVGVQGSVAIEVQEGLTEEPVVEVVIFLKLNFGEEDGFGDRIVGGQKYAINAKGGFFDFDGLEAVALGKSRF
jgi:hypothetical protein